MQSISSNPQTTLGGTSFDEKELKARFNPEGSLLRRHQLKMLDLVVELDRICKKHNIPYFLYGGTLLGAIRHNGFIPWDDDLDVALYRKDYLRLLEVLPKELPDDIVFQENETDKNYFYFFAKLRDKHSILQEESPYDQVFKEKGIYIDIFPFERQNLFTHLICEPIQGHTFKIFRTAKNISVAMKKIRVVTWLCRYILFPLFRFISSILHSKTFTYSYGIPFHIVYDEADIFPLTTHDFEGMSLPIPHNSHHMLQTQYGDYMQLPDLKKLDKHVAHLEFLD